MAGGGVGEAMLIGAAVGAGTGGIMSAAQDKDVGQGMLLGALGGAATGGIGSGIGGAAGSAAENIAANAATNTATDIAANTAAQSVGDAALNQFSTAAADQAAQQVAQQTAQQTAQAGASDIAQVVGSRQGDIVNGVQTAANPTSSGTGIASGLTTGQQIGAGTAGGISGLMAANGQPAPYQAPEQEQYNGPLSQFKMAGPSLSQYNYNPNSFQPSIAPGFAEGGIADLQTGLYPQSQMDRTQFATPTQMPISREIIASDYDQTINPYTGDLPRFGEGGGINFIHNLQPGGEFGDMTADMYGAVQEHKPKWLQDMEPGGFIGALTPGKLDWEEKKRKEEEDKINAAREMKEAKAAAMYNQMAGGNPQAGGGMAHGGIADLGSYSDGGRLLRGPGDGMSDNIPASIGGKQPARLADGEFVVPADVVSHLGNGSTDAGAKTLYSMMDKVRKARTGTKKQGKEINADKYIPGMAGGGIASIKRYDEGGEATTDQPVEEKAAAAPPPPYNPSVYNPTTYNYSPYTVANRPSGNAPQYYGDIYRGEYADYSTPGYTLTGGNLGRWNNVAGEAARAAQPASMNQQVTQAYLQNLGRAPDQAGMNYWMGSGLSGPDIARQMQTSPEGKRMAPGAVDAYHQQLLGRNADQAGMDFWSGMMGSGNYSPSTVRQHIANSPEAQIRQNYSSVLGRSPDAGGANYFYDLMNKGMSSEDVRGNLMNSAEARYKADKARSPWNYTFDEI